MNVICLIPARGGSERLPRKNIKELAGEPLLGYVIRAAKAANVFAEIVVSTEDSEIADIASRYEVRVDKRPDDLATNSAGVPDVARALLKSEAESGRNYDGICTLMCTCPLVEADDVANAYRLFVESGTPYVLSVVEAETPAVLQLRLDKTTGELSPVHGPENFRKRRQDMPMSYQPNGSMFFYKTQPFLDGGDVCAGKTLAYLMPPERSVNIDTQLDYDWADFLIRRRGAS